MLYCGGLFFALRGNRFYLGDIKKTETKIIFDFYTVFNSSFPNNDFKDLT